MQELWTLFTGLTADSPYYVVFCISVAILMTDSILSLLAKLSAIRRHG